VRRASFRKHHLYAGGIAVEVEYPCLCMINPDYCMAK